MLSYLAQPVIASKQSLLLLCWKEILPPVPRLNQPLIPDEVRRVQLQRRLSVHFIGRHDAAHFPQFLGILEKKMLLEKRIEAALVADGYDSYRILEKIHEIRGLLFNHPTQGVALAQRTLDGYLCHIERYGTRQSIPYIRVVSAIRNLTLLL